MAESTISSLELILARIEGKQDAMMEKLDRLEKQTDTHWKKIAELETKIAVLEQRQGPKVHWSSIVGPLVGIAAFVAAYVTYITK
jgi:phage shock protein A